MLHLAPCRACPGSIPAVSRRAFTLVELLVVVAIISLLAAVLFPVFARTREKARQTVCASHLKQLVLAWQMYATDYDDVACPSYVGYANPAWDFAVVGTVYVPGLLGAYTTDGQIAGCPDWVNVNPVARPVNGYAYNATYLGGDMNTPYGNFPPSPLSRILQPAQTCAFADGAFINAAGVMQPQNFLRAPSDVLLVPFSTGTAHFRHSGSAEVGWADGHVSVAHPALVPRPAFPDFGGLSADDSAYGPGMKPASAYAY